MLATSRYTEDIHPEGHSSVWGSYYCVATHRWGYACCLLPERGAKCGALPALEAAPGGCTSPPQKPSSEIAATVSEKEVLQAPSEKTLTEVERILAAPVSKPFEVLGLASANVNGYSVRSAFRRLALLVHPDKNPGHEDRCKQALLRASAAREAAESLLGSSSKASSTPAAETAAETASKKAPEPRDQAAGREPEGRERFGSPEEFIANALQFALDEWYRYVSLSIAGSDGSARKVRRAVGVGPEEVLRSEAAMQQTAESVKALRRLLHRQALGREVLDKIEAVCLGMISKEYSEANQAYMNLAIGNKTWHSEVPTLMEGGMGGMSGVERGQMWKQARTAQRLNAAKTKSVMDDEEVRCHVVALRRLLTVAQVIRPNADPSRNAG